MSFFHLAAARRRRRRRRRNREKQQLIAAERQAVIVEPQVVEENHAAEQQGVIVEPQVVEENHAAEQQAVIVEPQVVERTPIAVAAHVTGAAEQQAVIVEPQVVERTPIAVAAHVPGAAKEAVVLVAVDWANLPSDNLRSISNRCASTLDLARFRSTCRSWRSIAVPTNPEHNWYLVPGITPRLNPSADLPFGGVPIWNRQTILLLTPPPTNSSQNQQPQQPWLVNVQLNSQAILLLGPPIHCTLWHPIRPNMNIKLRYFENDHLFSKTFMDLTKFSSVELANRLLLNDGNRGHVCHERTAWIPNENAIVALSMHQLHHPRAIIYFGGEHQRRIIPFPPEYVSPECCDICVFKNRPYFIDLHGRCFTLNPDFTVEIVVAEPIKDPNNVHLVVNHRGTLAEELLLVDQCSLMDEIPIRVYRLNARNWVQVFNLGETVIFLASDIPNDVCRTAPFTASASELMVDQGNCVVYYDGSPMFVPIGSMLQFNLDNQTSTRVSPQFLKLFWPPPEWVRTAIVRVNDDDRW